MASQNIHTVFDRMTAKGLFRQNPANIDSVDPLTGQSAYKGPVQFPKMLYHPKGKTRIIVQAEAVATPFGPTMNNQQSEIINKIVNSEAELANSLADGWHEHPSDAIAAGFTKEDLEAGLKAPPKGAASRVASLEDEVAKLQKELDELKAGAAPLQDDSKKEDE